MHLKSRTAKHLSSEALVRLPTGMLNSCGLCYEEEILVMPGLAAVW